VLAAYPGLYFLLKIIATFADNINQMITIYIFHHSLFLAPGIVDIQGLFLIKTKTPEGFPSVHDINRPQRHRCRFLQALCLIWFSSYRDLGVNNIRI
jgi:hypothetical protein